MEPNIVSRGEWLAARSALLRDEKALMRYKDYIAERRRALPWVEVTDPYVFDTSDGERTLPQLFDGATQLIVYHFMFGPDWDSGCGGCTQVADTLNQAVSALSPAETEFVAVSRAPLAKLAGYAQTRQWSFKWVSSANSQFNYDYNVSLPEDGATNDTWSFQSVDFERGENHGISVFVRRDHQVYHTYSSYNRSVELFMAHLQLLDLCPSGRYD